MKRNYLFVVRSSDGRLLPYRYNADTHEAVLLDRFGFHPDAPIRRTPRRLAPVLAQLRREWSRPGEEVVAVFPPPKRRRYLFISRKEDGSLDIWRQLWDEDGPLSGSPEYIGPLSGPIPRTPIALLGLLDLAQGMVSFPWSWPRGWEVVAVLPSKEPRDPMRAQRARFGG